jgi:hypothetical protein
MYSIDSSACQDHDQDFSFLISDIQQYILKDIDDPNYFLTNNKKLLIKNFKKINPRAKQLQIELLWKIACCSKDKKNPKPMYYTEQELADYFSKTLEKKITRQAISKTRKSLEKYGIIFIRIPTKVVNPSLSKNSSGRYIPITISLIKEVYKFVKLQCAELGTTVCGVVNYSVRSCGSTVCGVVNDSDNMKLEQNQELTENFKPLLCKDTMLVTMLTFKIIKNYFKSMRIPSADHNQSFLSLENQKMDESKKLKLKTLLLEKKVTSIKNIDTKLKLNTLLMEVKPKHFIGKKYKKFALKVKEKTNIDYKDFGLHPNYFDSLKHIKMFSNLKSIFDNLIFSQVSPRPADTTSIIKYWNACDNMRFKAGCSENKTSSAIFKQLNIAVSYRMSLSHDLTLQQVYSAIDNFNKISNYHGKLKYSKRLNLINFLLDDKWFPMCLKTTNEVFTEGLCKNTIYTRTLERTKNSYAKYYHKGSLKLARSDFEKFHAEFIKFTNEIVDEHSSVHMNDWSISKLINEYFYWTVEYTSNWKNTPSTKSLLSLRSRFYADVINGPIGQNTEFGRPLTEDEIKERRQKEELKKITKKLKNRLTNLIS